jgi:hypothetical protein
MIKQVDYKGKYFILQDELDDKYGMDFEIGEMKEEDITDEFLKYHCNNCIYYGIPAYIGKNQELKDRITKIENDIR